MKVHKQQITDGEESVVLRYRKWNEKWDAISRFAQDSGQRLEGIRQNSGQVELLAPSEILYFESVDGSCYAYSKEGEFRVKPGLGEIIDCYAASGFFRCSRTMVVNIYKMERLKSQSAGKIMATLVNGEQVLISRKYAAELRTILKRGRN